MPIIFFTIWIVVAIDSKMLLIFLATTRPMERNDRPDRSCRKENFTSANFSQISQILRSICRKKMFSQQKFLEKAYFIVKMIGPAMVQPASSDFWKGPLVFYI